MIPRIFPVASFSFYNDRTVCITSPVKINDNLSIEIAMQHIYPYFSYEIIAASLLMSTLNNILLSKGFIISSGFQGTSLPCLLQSMQHLEI